MYILSCIIIALVCLVFGASLGIYHTYKAISDDKQYSWQGKFYKVKEVSLDDKD